MWTDRFLFWLSNRNNVMIIIYWTNAIMQLHRYCACVSMCASIVTGHRILRQQNKLLLFLITKSGNNWPFISSIVWATDVIQCCKQHVCVNSESERSWLPRSEVKGYCGCACVFHHSLTYFRLIHWQTLCISCDYFIIKVNFHHFNAFNVKLKQQLNSAFLLGISPQTVLNAVNI